jgi:hypothetical protein
MAACRLLMKFAWPIEQEFIGLSRSQTLFVFSLTISLLSLAGIPPCKYAFFDQCPHCISRAVTLDICKFTYAQFINWDIDMYDEARDMPAVATKYGKPFFSNERNILQISLGISSFAFPMMSVAINA